jgi:hypothetical protein
MEFIAGVLVGALVAWNVLPQPAFIKSAYDALLAKFKSK